jgi:phenol 2-monooxygenase
LDDVIDVHAVFRGDPHALDVIALPEILLPHSGPLGLQDWEKVWAVDAARDIFAERSVSTEGAVVIVRPDQYVANVLPLSARGELTDFFSGILLDRLSAVAR